MYVCMYVMCVRFLDRRPAFGSCRQGLCMYVCVCVCVFPLPATCIQVMYAGFVCVCVSLTGDLYSGHAGRVCVQYVCVFP